MKYLKTSLIVLALLPASFAADKKTTLLDVSRDVAELQDQVRQLQRTLDEKLPVLQTLAQQSVDSSNKTGTGFAVLEDRLQQRIQDTLRGIVAPVAGLSAKLDQMGTDVSAVRDNVSDLTSRMNKLQTQVTDLQNLINVINKPIPPPTTTGVNGAPDTTGGGMAAATNPGMSATDLYNTAYRDREGGNFDLSLQEFKQYLTSYGTTSQAPNAQFYIGDIYYNKGDYPSAIKSFDMVLERYPDNNKTADALYMKGMSLWKSGQATAAGRTFLEVIQKYPKSDVAPKAREARKALGLSVPSASSGSKAKKRRRS